MSHILSRAFSIWWRDVVLLLLLNVAWFLLQIPIVTGPPATAMVYAMAQGSVEGEYWNWRDAWGALRKLFWPAWRWGVINVLVWVPGLWNLAAYWQEASITWFLLRLVWIGSLTLWLALNLFYWPFWLAQDDKTMLNTYRNCGRFLLLHPAMSLLLLVFCTMLAAISLVTTLPFTLALISWLALIGITAVQHSLSTHQLKPELLLSKSHKDERDQASSAKPER